MALTDYLLLPVDVVANIANHAGHTRNKDILIPSVSSQSLFSSLYSNAGTSKVFSLSMCAVLAIGVGISYMQRYSAVDPLSL